MSIMPRSPSYIRVDGYLYRRADELPDRAAVEKKIIGNLEALFSLWEKYHLPGEQRVLPGHMAQQNMREKKFGGWLSELSDIPFIPGKYNDPDIQEAAPYIESLHDLWKRFDVPHWKFTSFDNDYKQSTVRDTFARWVGNYAQDRYPGVGL